MTDARIPARAVFLVALAFATSACSSEAPQATAGPAVVEAATPASANAGLAAAPSAQVDAATARPGAAMVGPMPAFGGGMQALAEHCGTSSAAELQSLKRQQRELAIQSGMSGAQFDAEYAKGYSETAAKARQGTPAEREKACAQLRELEQFGEQMQQREAARQR